MMPARCNTTCSIICINKIDIYPIQKTCPHQCGQVFCYNRQEVIPIHFFEDQQEEYRRRDRMIVERTLAVFDNPAMYGLQDRPGQNEMALDIAEAIRDQRHIMVEAGVGIGKSLGYLIPSLFASQCFSGPIVIATSSIALSEQLMQDALQAQRITGVKADPVLAKGANNYVCINRVIEHEEQLADYRQGKYGDEFDERLLEIPDWVLDHAHLCKDRSEFPRPMEDWVWRYINADRCQSSRCAFKTDCGFQEMRRKIGESGSARIIIANQDLFIVNQINEYRGGSGFINPNRRIVIIDEAHNLENKTRSALTERWGQARMLHVIERLQRPMAKARTPEKYYRILDISQAYIEQLMSASLKQIKRTVENDPERREAIRYPVPTTLKADILAKWSALLRSLENALIMLSGRYSTARFTASDEEAVDRLVELREFISSLAGREKDDSNFLFWLEKNDRQAGMPEICYAPQKIDQELHRLLFSNREVPVILTSATLCQPGKSLYDAYRYITSSLGFAGGETYIPKPSPFPYDENAMLYIADDLEDPAANHDLYLTQTADRIAELAKISGGRTLVLFTAKEDLRVVYGLLKRKKLPWPLLRQKDGGAQGNVKAEFIASGGILLSTGFWEGFNIPGPPLSSVIITRLPFPVPDPVIEYKISQSADRFTVLLPEMLLKLRQGAGRLIRDEKDTGILSILDSRASGRRDKPYRGAVLEALPIRRVTEDLAEITEFARSKLAPVARNEANCERPAKL